MRKPPRSLDAWAAYQRGLWHLSKVTAEDFSVAEDFFERGIKADPTFAGCYSSLALARLQASAIYQSRGANEAQSSAESFARQAVARAIMLMPRPAPASAGHYKLAASLRVR